jgi:endonuclease/exonuclease/phosphatase family metal-dependent hydrolase
VVFWLLVAAFLAPALLVTFCRLTEPSGRVGIAMVSFTPLAMPLYVVAAVLVGVRLVRLRTWRSAALPVTLVAIAGLVVHGWWYAPQVSGPNPPPAEGATPLVVMTANLLMGEADGVEVVRTASEEDVDLLVVEEVTPAVLADMDRAGLDELLPYRVGEAGSGASGTMAFSRQELTDPVRVDTYLGTWAFTMGDLRVLAVHPSYPVDADGWARDHGVIADAAAQEEADLLVGDFNATADNAPLRHLADLGYRDVGELANDGWNPTWPARGTFHGLGLPVVQIDHVLVGPELASEGMSTVAVPDSDHRAVVARVARK